ncbi:MAG: hypothetical protein J7J91_07700 [Deltaproteobacteria bacterium]|nr:hypothetical protein [Deltaproteobacteria bacterium]
MKRKKEIKIRRPWGDPLLELKKALEEHNRNIIEINKTTAKVLGKALKEYEKLLVVRQPKKKKSFLIALEDFEVDVWGDKVYLKP